MSVRMPWRARLSPVVLAVVVATGTLPGCGGGGGTTSATPVATAPPAPTPAPPTVIAQGNGGLGVRVLGIVPFSTATAGRLDVTVDWTFARNDVDVYLARGACALEQFNARGCDLLAFSESTSSKPETVGAPGASAGGYTLMIGNLGPDEESVAYQVVLTPGAAGAASAARVPPSRVRTYQGSTALGHE